MCNWPNWSALYKKCNLHELPQVAKLSGSDDIKNFCSAIYDRKKQMEYRQQLTDINRNFEQAKTKMVEAENMRQAEYKLQMRKMPAKVSKEFYNHLLQQHNQNMNKLEKAKQDEIKILNEKYPGYSNLEDPVAKAQQMNQERKDREAIDKKFREGLVPYSGTVSNFTNTGKPQSKIIQNPTTPIFMKPKSEIIKKPRSKQLLSKENDVISYYSFDYLRFSNPNYWNGIWDNNEYDNELSKNWYRYNDNCIN